MTLILNLLEVKSFFGTTYAFGKTINTHLIGQLLKNYINGNDNLTAKYRML